MVQKELMAALLKIKVVDTDRKSRKYALAEHG
jgi:hypothetical protein